MSISLNITSGSSPKMNGAKQQLKKPGATPPKKKSNAANETNDFSFKFTKNSTVKAVVAKRRNPAVLAKKSAALAAASAAAAAAPKLAATAAPQPAAAVEPTISLNVTAGSAQDRQQTAARLEKRKLNSKQRKEVVLEKRAQAFQSTAAQAIDTSTKTSGGIVEFGNAAPAPRPFAKPKPTANAERSAINQQNYARKQQATAAARPKKMPSLFANNPAVPVIGQRLVNPLTETVFTGTSVASIAGLHPHAIKNLADVLHITELTTVQQRTVPVVLQGRDVLVRSQTGSGKTLAYALPVVQRLQALRPKLQRDDGIRALVIVPTRELAIQVYELFVKLLKPYTWIVSGYLTGGEKRKAEKARLRKGINILVGTPGRLVDHLLHTDSFRLDAVKWLVLDEADRLFEMGYEKDVQKIVDVINGKGGVAAAAAAAPASGGNPFAKRDLTAVVAPQLPRKTRIADADDAERENEEEELMPQRLQSMLLSATLTASVRELAGLALKDPLFIDTSDVNADDVKRTNAFATAVDEAVADEKISLPSTVVQSYVLVPPKLRLVTLAGLVAVESQRAAKMLVFLGSEQMVDFHYDLMNEALTQKVLDSDDEGVESDGDDADAVMPKGGKKKKRGQNGKAAAKMLDEYESDADDGEEPYLKGVRFFKLHGALTQNERSAVFKAFKEAKSGVLLTTDVAGRGIDVPHVDLVVQFSPPQKIADYVHRVGRTARAGRSGRAVLFLSPNETDFVRILEGKKIRIAQDDANKLLKGIVRPQSAGATLEENASELQRKFETIVADDKEMHERACKAFVSWLRFIAAFPKDLRAIFNIKQAHMGHYAKSLGLREPPKSFAARHSAPKAAQPTNRLTYTERSAEPRRQPPQTAEEKRAAKKRPLHHAPGGGGSNLNSFNKFIRKSISLQTSEFGSGMPAAKKKKGN